MLLDQGLRDGVGVGASLGILVESLAEGRVTCVGRRTATAEARITDADGKLIAHGSRTCMVFPPEQGPRFRIKII